MYLDELPRYNIHASIQLINRMALKGYSCIQGSYAITYDGKIKVIYDICFSKSNPITAVLSENKIDKDSLYVDDYSITLCLAVLKALDVKIESFDEIVQSFNSNSNSNSSYLNHGV